MRRASRTACFHAQMGMAKLKLGAHALLPEHDEQVSMLNWAWLN